MRRWIRLDVGWDDSDWIAELSTGAQLAWVKLLCHCKRDGVRGVCKAISPSVAARRWNVTADDVREMIEAGRRDGAIHYEDGTWTLTTWTHYQGDPSNRDRQRRYRERHNGA